jgi:uncharacterized membrane protein YdjX (TVP38/TMEM64 family)
LTDDADFADRADVTGSGNRWSTGVVLRLGVVVGVVVGLVVLDQVRGLPDVHALQSRVAAAGGTGGLVFIAGFALLALLPVPKGAMTALGGLLFGLWLGAALSFAGALAGAVLAREAGGWLGRDTVERLTRGRLNRAESLLRDHGVGTVVAARLVPVLPYVVINYTCGLLGVRRRDYLLGSGVGLVPGSLTYAALGASNDRGSHLVVVLAAMLVLVVFAGAWSRRRLLPVAPSHPSHPSHPSTGPPSATTTGDPRTRAS